MTRLASARTLGDRVSLPAEAEAGDRPGRTPDQGPSPASSGFPAAKSRSESVTCADLESALMPNDDRRHRKRADCRAAVMNGAGLTHGGFYGHFGSKDDLAAEAVARALECSVEKQNPYTNLTELVFYYLVRTTLRRPRQWLRDCTFRVPTCASAPRRSPLT